MVVYKGIESVPNLESTTVAVGSFDGVHKGHNALLSALTASAKRHNNKSVVVSFSPHPRVTLNRAEGLQLLTSDDEKAMLLEQMGVQVLVLLEFTPEFSRLTYSEFVKSYLFDKLSMRELIVGFNHHMGSNGGGYDMLQELSVQCGFIATKVEEFSCDESQHISSTSVRKLLNDGKVSQANQYMGHSYIIVGRVENSGRVVIDEPLKLIPPVGEYNAVINGVEGRLSIVLDVESNSRYIELSANYRTNNRVEIEIISEICER